MVQDDLDLFELLREVFAPTHRLRRVARLESMTAIAAGKPTVLIVGPFPATDRASLSAWEVVALARAHRALRSVPIIVFTSDANLLTDDGNHLGAYEDVHVVGMPFSLDVLQHLVTYVERRMDPSAVPGRLGAQGQLPELCRHGYDIGNGPHPDGTSLCR